MRFTSRPATLFEISLTFRLEDVGQAEVGGATARMGSAQLGAPLLVEIDGARTWEWQHQQTAAPWPGRYASLFVRWWPNERALLARLTASFDSPALPDVSRAATTLIDDVRGRLATTELWLNGDGVYASGPTLDLPRLRELLADDAVVALDAAFEEAWPARTLSFDIERRPLRHFVLAPARAPMAG